MLIQGRRAGSKAEYYFAYGLERNGWEYAYQIPFFFGRLLPGGQVLDFLVFTVPLPTPVYIYGSYYHNQLRADSDKLARMTLKLATYGLYRDPIVVTDDKLQNFEDGVNVVRDLFGRRG